MSANIISSFLQHTLLKVSVKNIVQKTIKNVVIPIMYRYKKQHGTKYEF